MDKLGFTFYPKDWWTSETYFSLSPIQRYYYLESLFIMYSNNGYMKTQKTQLENRMRTQISDEDFELVTSGFILEDNKYTSPTVNKRLRKTLANRKNGVKGGRPKKIDEKPKEPNLETQNNPPLEREREREREYKYNKADFISDWNELRTIHLKKPSHLNSLPFHDLNEFSALIKENTRDDFRNAMIGLFKQKKLPNDSTSMQSNPSHFLKFFNSYLTAYHDTNDMLYGKKE